MIKRKEALETTRRIMAHLRYPMQRSVKRTKDRDSTSEASAPEPTRLDSWKGIASYFGRGVRTVQRWEREEGLPVHRLAHAKRGTVYADQEELASWWKRREMAPVITTIKKEAAATVKRFERVTTTSAATFSPAFSSNARLLTYVSDSGRDGDTLQVWIQQLGGAAMRLTDDQHECADPAFSADDTRIIFTAKGGESSRNLYEIPALGGRRRLLKRSVKSARFSPRQMAGLHLARSPRMSSHGGSGYQRRPAIRTAALRCIVRLLVVR
jgi:hypothetical protein